MDTLCELRVEEEFASMLFKEHEGERLSETTRRVEISTDDPRFEKIGALQKELRATMGRPFFYGWDIKHRYSSAELLAANCFRLIATSAFEPAGEECGTHYDETEACEHIFASGRNRTVSGGHTAVIPRSTCGVGAKQVSDLFLNWRRIPKKKDISRTIAGEIVVSKRLVDLCRNEGITGAEFRPVRQYRASSAQSKDWFQLVVQSADAEIAPPTQTGVNPFDHDPAGQWRCPRGHVIGLNLLSEVSIDSNTRGNADVFCTRQFIGARRGLLRPERLILISPRFQRLLESEKASGCGVEVAYFV